MEQNIETVIVTQARLGSTRLPGKVMLKVEGDELLRIHLDRLKKSKLAEKVLVATTTNEQDQLIADKANEWGMECYRGSEDDVLDRFYQAVKDDKPKWVVRVTSDCPLLDPKLIDAVIAFAQVNDIDYCANIIIENYPDGQDVEVFKFDALEKAWKEAKTRSDREHVTPYIRNNTDIKGGALFKGLNFPAQEDHSSIRMTVDEPRDFELMEALIKEKGTSCTWKEYVACIIESKLYELNSSIQRNEGFYKSLKED